MQSLPWKNGETCAGRTIWPIVWADKFVGENTCTFHRWSCTRRSIAKLPRTSGKSLTTRSLVQDLYGCRIPEYGWRRTVLHDKRHWRILTIHRASGLSWVHFAKRRRYIWTEGLDPREHQNWARVRLQSIYGVESRIESVNKDNYLSWVRISHGLSKLVTDFSSNKEDDDNEQETSEMQFEDFALKSNVLACAIRSKAKAKPQRRTLACSSTRTVPICERSWTDIEPEDYSPIAYPVSKQLSNLLRHGPLPREEDGAIEFWTLKEHLRNDLVPSQHWSDEKWKSIKARGGGNKKRFQYCTDSSGEIVYLRALQGHSGRNPIDPSLQDNVINSEQFLSSTFITSDVRSIYSPSRIQDWYREDKFWAKDRRYSSRLWILWTKNSEILTRSTWKHRFLHGTSRKSGRNIKTRCNGSTSNLFKRKDLSSIKTRSNAIILYDTLPAYGIPKAIMMKTGEIICEKVFFTSMSFEDFLLRQLDERIGFRSCWR